MPKSDESPCVVDVSWRDGSEALAVLLLVIMLQMFIQQLMNYTLGESNARDQTLVSGGIVAALFLFVVGTQMVLLLRRRERSANEAADQQRMKTRVATGIGYPYSYSASRSSAW